MPKTTRFRFSASAIERLSCPDGTKAVEVSDADGVSGLRLAVTRSSKTFWFRFVLAGTKGAIRLGTSPALSVADARRLALAHRAQVEQGIDPRQQEEKIDLTFGEFAQAYLAYSRQHKRSHADDASKLKCWLLPAFAHIRLKDLRRRHIEAYLAELRQTHSPASVNRHLTLLSAMGRRAVALDYVERNWCAGIDRLKEWSSSLQYAPSSMTMRGWGNSHLQARSSRQELRAHAQCATSMRLIPIRPRPHLHQQWHRQLRDAGHQLRQFGADQLQLALRHFEYEFVMHLQDEPRLHAG